jgi:hypothetical protein
MAFLLLVGLAFQSFREGHSWLDVFGRECPSSILLGCPRTSHSTHLVLRVAAASVVRWVELLPICQLTIVASRCRIILVLFWAFLVEVAAPTP